MEQAITFDQLPTVVSDLCKNVDDLRRLIVNNSGVTQKQEQKSLYNIQEAAKFLDLSVPTMYAKAGKEIAVHKPKGSKRLYFTEKDLIEYVKKGRQKTNAEIESEAEDFLAKKRKEAKT